MLTTSRLGSVVLLALGLALPASASATNRYASPTDLGSGNCLSESNSCDLPTAVSGAGANDDIFVRGDMGDYSLSSQLTKAAAIHVHGTHGRPRLIFSVERFTLQPGSSADNLYVQLGGAFGDVQLLASTADNLIVKQTAHDHAIYMENSTLTNSVAWAPTATGAGEQPLELDKSNTLRNVTAYAPTAGAVAIIALGRDTPSPRSDIDTFVNVIARGGSGGAGIQLFQDDGVDLTVNVNHSNYSSAEIDTDSDDLSKVHLNTDATDQTAAPVFANAGLGDFHQLLGSPTIDKGVNSAANGATDFDGGARTLNGSTDIGADEYIPVFVGGGGGGPGGGGPGGGGGDTDSPEASLSGSKRQKLGRYVVVSVTSDETGTASASGTLSVPGASKTFRLKKASKAVTASTKVKLKLKVSAKARRAAKRALRRGRRVKAKLNVAVADGAGNRDTAKRTVRLKR